jgi:hypothetical protein
MTNKNPKKEAQWAEAIKKCRLNTETVRMAKEMGLNPLSLIKNIPSKDQLWKAPVHVWIRELYEKKQAKAAAKKQRKIIQAPEASNFPSEN